MPIDYFTKEEFEKALPKHKDTGVGLWSPLGLDKGEWTYAVPVKRKDGAPITIMIRSSVRADGVAASTGKDSIRMWLEAGISSVYPYDGIPGTLDVDPDDYEYPDDATPEEIEQMKQYLVDSLTSDEEDIVSWIHLGKGAGRWITRVSGWEERLTKKLQEVYLMGLNVSRCPVCGRWKKVFVVKKKNKNKGRIFEACKSCERDEDKDSQFRWLS